MTMTDQDIRDTLAAALRKEGEPWPGAPSPEVVAAALLPIVRKVAADAAARELRATADAWQWGAWADTPRHSDRVADRIGAAQHVTDWLRGRADELDPS
jgi:hypothetical protein